MARPEWAALLRKEIEDDLAAGKKDGTFHVSTIPGAEDDVFHETLVMVLAEFGLEIHEILESFPPYYVVDYTKKKKKKKDEDQTPVTYTRDGIHDAMPCVSDAFVARKEFVAFIRKEMTQRVPGVILDYRTSVKYATNYLRGLSSYFYILRDGKEVKLRMAAPHPPVFSTWANEFMDDVVALFNDLSWDHK